MKPLISVCMIVKNEEKVLRRCLESIKGISDEIIIADTGSSDRTKKIALEYTDTVYDYKWDDDFSKARNFVASKASGEWIIALDADEYLDRESFISFKRNLKNSPPDSNILAVQIVNFVGVNGKDTVLNYHERIYKNDGHISYYRNIHEMLKHKESKEKKGFAQLQIFHSGYMQNVVKEKGKSIRNLSLLKNKTDKEPIDYYFLGNEYYQLGELDKAIHYYKKGYQLKEDIRVDWVKKLLVRLAACLHAANRDKEALKLIDACEEVFVHLVDFKFLKGKLYFDAGKIMEPISIFEEILLKKNQLTADSSIDYLEYLPHKYLGELYEKDNQLKLAVHHYSKALSINDADDYIWTRLISLLAKHVSYDELTQFINNNCITNRSMSSLRLITILLSVPNENVQKLTRSYLNDPILSSEEKEALLLKNLFLDAKNSEIIDRINSKSLNEFVSLLSKGLFNVVDFILLTLDTNEEKYESILYNLKFEKPINNFLDIIFGTKNKKLSLHEEELFISILKQSYVLQMDKIISILNSKIVRLSPEVKIKLKKYGV